MPVREGATVEREVAERLTREGVEWVLVYTAGEEGDEVWAVVVQPNGELKNVRVEW